jgi:hypothetical protein
MFGFGNKSRRRGRNSGGVFGGNNLRNAALAGAGIMAIRWLRNRRAAGSSGMSGTAGTGGFGGSSSSSSGGTF